MCIVAGLYKIHGLQLVSTHAAAVQHSQSYRPPTILGAIPLEESPPLVQTQYRGKFAKLQASHRLGARPLAHCCRQRLLLQTVL